MTILSGDGSAIRLPRSYRQLILRERVRRHGPPPRLRPPLSLSVIAEGVSLRLPWSTPARSLATSDLGERALAFLRVPLSGSTGHPPKVLRFKKAAKASPEAQLIAAVSPLRNACPAL
jgi:hypothetical protein